MFFSKSLAFEKRSIGILINIIFLTEPTENTEYF